MTIRNSLVGILAANRHGLRWLEARRTEQRRRDWTTVHKATFGKTSLSVYTTIGIGDVMVAKQLSHEFVRYCETNGDPKLGSIIITAGAWPFQFTIPRGDHNVYWWWSMNGQDDWLDQHINKSSSTPDVVACLSKWCGDYASGLGVKTLYLPLATGEHFQSLRLERAGIGYAGSKGHKDFEQVARIIGPFSDDPQFTWASGFKLAEEISRFYNSKQIVLGMTETYQEKAGMVNNRVFEVLATGTPFLIHRHRALEELLGCPYPYQSGSAEETRRLADSVLSDYPAHLAAFEGYRQLVQNNHLYKHRLRTLLGYLAERD